MKLICSIVALVGLLMLGYSPAQAQASTDQCYNITWYGGGAGGTTGKTVRGMLSQAPYIIRYEWKNGTMSYDWIHNGGRVDGMVGTWKQDGSNGTFRVQTTDNGFEGTWSSAGKPAKHKLIFTEC